MIGWKISLFFFATVVSTVYSHPAGDDKEQPQFGNLKYTFGSKDEIPAAFFESEPVKKSNESSPSPPRNTRAYPACQDGSGGLCVEAGKCPSNLRPEPANASACVSGQECCLGPPSDDKFCGSRGGECVPSKQCGNAPKYTDAVDCDQKNDEVCCIWL